MSLPFPIPRVLWLAAAFAVLALAPARASEAPAPRPSRPRRVAVPPRAEPESDEDDPSLWVSDDLYAGPSLLLNDLQLVADDLPSDWSARVSYQLAGTEGRLSHHLGLAAAHDLDEQWRVGGELEGLPAPVAVETRDDPMPRLLAFWGARLFVERTGDESRFGEWSVGAGAAWRSFALRPAAGGQELAIALDAFASLDAAPWVVTAEASLTPVDLGPALFARGALDPALHDLAALVLPPRRHLELAAERSFADWVLGAEAAAATLVDDSLLVEASLTASRRLFRGLWVNAGVACLVETAGGDGPAPFAIVGLAWSSDGAGSRATRGP